MDDIGLGLGIVGVLVGGGLGRALVEIHDDAAKYVPTPEPVIKRPWLVLTAGALVGVSWYEGLYHLSLPSPDNLRNTVATEPMKAGLIVHAPLLGPAESGQGPAITAMMANGEVLQWDRTAYRIRTPNPPGP